MMSWIAKYPAGRPPRMRRAFTLIEAAMVTSIIGFGVLAMLTLLGAGTSANNDATELTTGMNLARNIRELALGLKFADPTTPTHWGSESGETLATYNDIDDLDGKTFSPPLDARRQTLPEFGTWQQSIVVETVDPDMLTLAVPKGTQPANRVTVTVSHNGRTVYSMSWFVFDAGT
jgi:type II secretory pathway pseudopilin PulG